MDATKATPRELLIEFTNTAVLIGREIQQGQRGACKGERGLKRAAKKRRRREKMVRERRVTLCSYAEQERHRA